MISLTGLISQKAFGKFEMGKVISNPFANAFIKEGEGEDHEVSMANNSIDIIIKMATELKAKMGEDEKQIPAWIQDHIAKAENLISQASGNYHEYGDSNESVNEAIKENDWKTIYNVFVKFLKANTKALEIRVMMRDEDATKKAIKSIISGLTNAQRSLKLESVVNEEPAKSTGEKIQNLNNRIKALKDKMAATKSSEQKNLIQQRLKNALQSLSNYKKQNISKESKISEDKGPCWQGYKQVGMKNKGGRQVPNCVPNESVVREAKGRGFATIQNDMAKVVDAIQSELEKYKSNKGTDKAKQNVENLKKLNVQKQRLEDELDGKVTSLYADYDLDQLHFMGRKK